MSRTLVIAALYGAAVLSSLRALEVGESAPKFANPDLDGSYVRHTDIVGGRWVIVSFFATWCGPCKEELEELEALQREAGGDRLTVLVFATDTERRDVTAYFAERPTNTRVLLDPYHVTYDRYNPGETALPTIFLVNPSGLIELKHVGYSPQVIARIRAKVIETP